METEQKLHLAFDEAGTGEPAVVLVHGLFGDRHVYDSQFEHLTRRRRVLRVDLRGHGASDVPEAGYSLDLLAADVERVCAAAGVKSAVFCGHSMAVTLKLAARRPDLVRGLVMLDGAVLLPPPAVEGQRRLAAALESGGWPDAAIEFFTGVAGPAAEAVRAAIQTAPPYYAAPMLRDISGFLATGEDARELAALRCPLLYVRSQIPADLDRLRQLVPDVWIEEIRDAGHWSMLTAPDRVNELLDGFDERVSA